VPPPPHPAAAPQVFEILEAELASAQQACSRVKLCPALPPTPLTPPAPLIRSNLSDTSGEKAWPGWANGSGYFLHITDQHLDQLYRRGFSSDCGLPLCCRLTSGLGNDSNAAGKYGCVPA
jgi:hypothetical protein